MNIGLLLHDAARRYPNEVALSDGRSKLSYSALADRARNLSRGLRLRGVDRGDRIVLYMPNGPDYVVSMFAGLAGGFIIVPVNSKLHPREIAYILDHCGARVLIVAPENEHSIRQFALPQDLAIVTSNELQEVVSEGAAATLEWPGIDRSARGDDTAWLFYTSGTTGRPKGAQLTHRNHQAMTVAYLADITNITSSDKVLHVAPLSHGSGLYLLPAIARGAENLLYDGARFEPDSVLETVIAQRVTAIAFLAPTMMVRLLRGRDELRPTTLRHAVYGGAPIQPHHLRASTRRFGPIFSQIYGQGEAPMTITSLAAAEHVGLTDARPVPAGWARSGVEIAAVTNHGDPIYSGALGEVVVRGDVVMSGYWGDEHATRAALRDGWLHTGDVGTITADGCLTLVDRLTDLIITGGANVYPSEVEDVLCRHPDIEDAVVFGVSDEEWGERVAAAILPRHGAAIDQAKVSRWCQQHLAGFKKPTLVEVVAEVPRNAYGKVLRRALRAAYEEQLAPSPD